MGSETKSRKQRLRQYLEGNRPAAIGEAEWNQLRQMLGPVSESYLRELLRAAGLPVAQPWAGVRQKNFDELEASLLDLAKAYSEALTAGLKDRARYCRRVVISAKDHARLAARNTRTTPGKRAEKEEMVEWMLVWLGDPAMFEPWVRLRRSCMTSRCSREPSTKA